jgi:hypothetical protein
MTSKRRLHHQTCLLIAPAKVDVTAATKSLLDRRLELVRVNSLMWDTTGGLRNTIRECDFVCVYSPDEWTQSTLFEIGVAAGLGKRIFMVVGETPAVPADLRAMSYVVADRWNPSVIEPHLDAFLSTIPVRQSQRVLRKVPIRPRRDFSHERMQLAKLVVSASPRELESFVEALFRKASMNVTASPIQDFGADFAIVSPAIKRQFKNPILVEVKHGGLQSDLNFAVRKLVNLIAKGRGSAALLVTSGHVPESILASTSAISRTVPILVMTVDNLIQSLERGTLIADIVDYTKRQPSDVK